MQAKRIIRKTARLVETLEAAGIEIRSVEPIANIDDLAIMIEGLGSMFVQSGANYFNLAMENPCGGRDLGISFEHNDPEEVCDAIKQIKDMLEIQ